MLLFSVMFESSLVLEQSTISSKSFSVFVSKFPSIGVKILVSLVRYGSLFWLSALHVRIKFHLAHHT